MLLARGRTRGAYENVLVGVDFSVYSRRAVAFAERVAPDAQATLIHAYEIPFKNFLSGRARDADISAAERRQIDAELRREADAFLASLSSDRSEAKVVTQEGLAWEVLRNKAAEIGADLVIVGTHGRVGVAHALLGSVAQDMLCNAPCDVLVVKAW